MTQRLYEKQNLEALAILRQYKENLSKEMDNGRIIVDATDVLQLVSKAIYKLCQQDIAEGSEYEGLPQYYKYNKETANEINPYRGVDPEAFAQMLTYLQHIPIWATSGDTPEFEKVSEMYITVQIGDVSMDFGMDADMCEAADAALKAFYIADDMQTSYDEFKEKVITRTELPLE